MAAIQRRTTALCLIVWNEREGCEADVPKMDFTGFDEVFAIDGGSTDGTIEFLKASGVEVRPQVTRSLNAAYWQAVESSRCDNLVVFFPKGTLDPAILQTFLKLLNEGIGLVVASRLQKGARNEEDEHFLKPRKWGVVFLAVFSSLMWRREGPMILDVLHGVKGFSKDAFLAMNPSEKGVTIDLEMAVRSYRRRIRRIEFPVIESSRAYGATKFKLIPTAKKLGRFLVAELMR